MTRAAFAKADGAQNGTLAGALEAAADLAAAGDRFERLRAKLDCEAFAMRERMEARSAAYFRKRDLERAR